MIARSCGKTFRQALNLNVERLVAILIELLEPVRHERKTAQAPFEADIGKRWPVLEMNAPDRLFRMAGGDRIVVEGRHAHPLQTEALHIDIGHRQTRAGIEPS